jgi:enamine deaminase RidA (YjgF/YER057c/UK114 family)
MNSIDSNLKKLNISLPDPKAPVGAYVATKITGKLLFISGQVSIDKDSNLIKGKIGKDLSLEQGYAAAERCGLSLIAHVKKACDGDLEKVKSCIKLTGYVNSIDTFIDQPKVINGASDIIAKIFDKKGEHTRAAVSVNSLPLGVAVEVDGIFELN